MTAFLHAIDLNNEGIEQIVDNRTTPGLGMLTSSIKLLKQELARINSSERYQRQPEQEDAVMTDPSDSSSSVGADDDDAFYGRYVLDDSMPTESASQICAEILTELPGLDECGAQHEYIFNCAITVPMRGMLSRRRRRRHGNGGRAVSFEAFPTEQDVQVCSATVIFNLALEHHRHALAVETASVGDAPAVPAIKTPDDKQSQSQRRTASSAPSPLHDRNLCFMKAERLYSMVVKLLSDREASSMSTLAMEQMALLAQLAAYNNLAQLCYTQGRYDDAHQVLSQLACLVRDMASLSVTGDVRMDQRYARMTDQLMQEPQLQGILMNALFLRSPRAAAAA